MSAPIASLIASRGGRIAHLIAGDIKEATGNLVQACPAPEKIDI
ncbi:MAG: hypothetical protein ACLP1D_26465 [Xanthobacteraceae bacterium]